MDTEGRDYVRNTMPIIGLGTYQIQDEDTLYEVIDAGLEAGYRCIDTAQLYGNEDVIGNVLSELLPKHGLRREDIFISTKLSPACQGKDKADKAIEESLDNLEIDYIDLLIIHWPGICKMPGTYPHNQRLRKESWQVLEEYYTFSILERGDVRAIGVSNYEIRHLEELLEYCSVLPALNQIEYHPHFHQTDLVEYCKNKEISFQVPLHRFKIFSLLNTIITLILSIFRIRIATTLILLSLDVPEHQLSPRMLMISCTPFHLNTKINVFRLEPVPKSSYGVFYTGDAYICLMMGVAAIKTVEIDQALGGLPVQHREIQDHESSLFLSYFPDGIRYINGGYDTGYKHVEDIFKDWKPKLFHCKGKRNIRCTQVDCKKDSLNLGDVFILDLGRDIYVWMPPESGRLERIKTKTGRLTQHSGRTSAEKTRLAKLLRQRTMMKTTGRELVNKSRCGSMGLDDMQLRQYITHSTETPKIRNKVGSGNKYINYEFFKYLKST
uniref:Aldo_ket_red domain-containing protein n=1 Tax=Heterorhabditis bacteriophora TaxID=37862 RepID=A0A1I7X355_HETBA